MKPDILVDTSAWIDYFNKPNSKIGKAVEKVIKQEKALIAGIILTELLQGARAQEEYDVLLDSMLALPILETELSTWIEAGRLAFALRREGITIPTTDLIIAALAIQDNRAILTLDHHFQKIPGIQLFQNF
jgi:predicted nucleic acid-binding protein